ncbi:Rtr1/RPAP2 family-domain-containing protein [Aspergillus pseudoustus]|uniref:RNA polymerase II subunit B1 CTD phosphatase RPAP2 homolog n=1 Tax=Aspergillus pseudoustus TaxID=1810923 RepID=A0ABR4KZA4_9EURO
MSSDPPVLKTSLPSIHAASSRQSNTSLPKPRPGNSRRSPLKPKQKPSKPETDPRHLAIALHHAHRIQAQKDAQDLILDRILELVTLPSSPSADPASPSVEDIRKFKSALVPFQPADYDNLIQERNIEGLCGYGLCPREHRKENSRGTFRITWGARGSGPGGRGREMNIVPREQYEMWCSDACAERAMYIRVQLAAEPVWERRSDDLRGKELLLLEEARSSGKGKSAVRDPASVKEVLGQLDNLHMDITPEPNAVADDISRLTVQDYAHTRELAMERGDQNPALQNGRVDVQIQEKTSFRNTITAPEMRPGDEKGGSIEGYVPKDS